MNVAKNVWLSVAAMVAAAACSSKLTEDRTYRCETVSKSVVAGESKMFHKTRHLTFQPSSNTVYLFMGDAFRSSFKYQQQGSELFYESEKIGGKTTVDMSKKTFHAKFKMQMLGVGAQIEETGPCEVLDRVMLP